MDSTDPESSWDDEHYKRALAHLDALQQQINSLRAALPITIAPLVSLTSPENGGPTTPSQVYTSFATNAIKTSYEVRQLRDTWTDEQTTQILEKVQDSVSRNGPVQTFNWALKGEIQGMKTEDPDDKLNGMIVKQEPDLEVQTQEEDEGEVVDSFGDAFRGTKIVEVDRNSEGHINIAVRMRFGRSESLRFTVQRTASQDQENWYYRAACIQGMTPKIRESITRCLEARPRRRDLNSTVYLLASYSDFMLAKCNKCQKKLGPGAMLSTARGRTHGWEHDLKTGWQAWHEQCLD